jgi:hypothetical protein
MSDQSLSGLWQFRFQGDSGWRPIQVPGCWESLEGVPKNHSGPAQYKTRVSIPEFTKNQRVRIHFHAVSYDCVVRIDGWVLGSHRGLWDAFTIDITEAVKPGLESELLVEVEKPAGRVAGYESEMLPGRFPVRETLSGFIPYVWGHIFGGIWQDVRLSVDDAPLFDDVHIVACADGSINCVIETSAPSILAVAIEDEGGNSVAVLSAETKDEGSGVFRSRIVSRVEHPRLWSPSDPVLHTARLRIEGGESTILQFGFRTLDAEQTAIRLNGVPIYPRMVLSWGWYPESLHSNPGPEVVEKELENLRTLGFNGVKFCLWYPPDYFFQIADRLGMLVWLEFPLWLPTAGTLLATKLFVEYERLARQARNHPSVIIYSLGCELNGEIGQEILEPLYQMIKNMIPQALVRDNSGSSEAYGGSLDESADFHDHHFYSDIQFFKGLLDLFAPRWRSPKPWVFGEFCDLDTYRDLRKMGPLEQWPWWVSADPEINPRGIRNPVDLPLHRERLIQNGYWERGAELEKISLQQALLHRKWTIEAVRAREEIGGYVITGQVDTPLTTSGIMDDRGQLKFTPEEFLPFQSDLVLLVGWDRKRAWVDGGDRVAFWDTWAYVSSTTVRPHFIASNYSGHTGPAKLSWQVGFDDEIPFAQGEIHLASLPGTVPRELAVVEFLVPALLNPRRATLRVRLDNDRLSMGNTWSIYCFPSASAEIHGKTALWDPEGRLADLPQIIPGIVKLPAGVMPEAASILISTVYDEITAAFVENGGKALLLQGEKKHGGFLDTVRVPFWRESIRVVEPHPAWGNFPHEGWAGLLFHGCATSCALVLPDREYSPILSRLDARTMALHAYALELSHGKGRMIVSTLRFEGGEGDQPSGIKLNTSAEYLLSTWVGWLSSDGNWK